MDSFLAQHDTYRSPATRSNSFLARLFLSSRHTFYLQVFVTVMNARRLARAGLWDDNFWCRDSLKIIRTCERVGMKLEISGIEHLRQVSDPVVFVSNHMSTLETFAFPAILVPFTKLTFVVKDSLVSHPIFGPVMSSRNPIVVGRTNAREDLAKVMKEGAERLSAGYSVVIFPQSTRSSIFRPGDFNSLGVKLAARNGVAVVPVALRTDAWGNGKRLKEFGPVRPDIPVRIRFGPHMTVVGKGADAHNEVLSFILRHLEEWGVPMEQ